MFLGSVGGPAVLHLVMAIGANAAGEGPPQCHLDKRARFDPGRTLGIHAGDAADARVDAPVSSEIPAQAGENAADDARRRYYRMTPLGRRVLAAEADRLASLVRAVRSKRLVPRARPS